MERKRVSPLRRRRNVLIKNDVSLSASAFPSWASEINLSAKPSHDESIVIVRGRKVKDLGRGR